MNEVDWVIDYIPIPTPDKIVISDGRIVDRTKVVFLLREDPRDKSILYATDRAYKSEGGTLRRLVPKETKTQRRQRKKNHPSQR
jgi:ERCC4-related helicase